jgi:hypothetical protein
MRNGPEYISNMRDGEWVLIKLTFQSARSGDRPRTGCLRGVMDAICICLERLCLGDAAQMLPAVLTVRGYFLRLVGQWPADDDQSSAGDDGSRAGWPGS